jgi:RNA polymerase sigma-70 factor (ECF subfamily)
MMDASTRAEVERSLHARCANGDWSGAATAALASYGPEILGFLFGLMNDEDAAREVFAMFCEDFWRGLPGFRWSCSLRTWGYTLARNAMVRFERDRARQRRHVPLSQAPELGGLRERVVTTMLSYLRSALRSRVAEIRRTLDREQQTLLVLRHDRGLSWPEIVHVLDGGGAISEVELARKAAALRKRYERLLRRLRQLYEQSVRG